MTASRALAVLFGVILMLAQQPSPVISAPRGKTPSPSASHVAGEVLVKFRASSSGTQKQSAVALRNHAVLASLTPSGWMHVRIADGQTVAQALAAYQNDPNVEYVQPNFIYRASAVPNDPQYNQLWALKNTGQTISSGTYNPKFGTSGADINIEKAWDHITDCRSVVVAVLDTGVNYNHEDLAANMWNGGPSFPQHGFDFVDNDNDPIDGQGHGTTIAAHLGAAGNNAIGVAGVCWRATIMAVRVLDATGRGTTATIIQGIDFAVTNGAKVINMSLGGITVFDEPFSAAITQAQNADVVVVVAAGNDGRDITFLADYPCSFTHSNLLCVAALDQNYALATFSNYGFLSVDVGAPGTNIRGSHGIQITSITDDFNDGGMPPALDWPGSGGGWAYRLTNAGTVDALVNPSTFPTSGTYVSNADQRVYRDFNLPAPGKVAAVLNFSAQFSFQSGDVTKINYRVGGGDPFASGANLDELGGTTFGTLVPLSYDLTPCIGVTCSVGFQLSSDASIVSTGIGIAFFSLDLVEPSNTDYRTINGTSSATPHVAGLATMLRAYNPQFTYVEVVNAIKNGGRSVADLNGNTTTGKAIDVMSSLAYINPPTGLNASVVR